MTTSSRLTPQRFSRSRRLDLPSTNDKGIRVMILYNLATSSGLEYIRLAVELGDRQRVPALYAIHTPAPSEKLFLLPDFDVYLWP